MYLIEAGLVLIVAPWTAWWQQNYFAELLPWIGPIMAISAVRALVVGTGAVTAIAGMSDLRAALVERLARRASNGRSPDSSLP